MKNKGIWFVMAGIIAAGILITILNTVFLNKQAGQETAYRMEQMQEGVDLPETTAVSAADVRPQEQAAAGGIPGDDGEDTAVTEGVLITPLETASLPAPKSEDPVMAGPSNRHNTSPDVEETIKNDYRARLDELDSQIERIRSEETEFTTYSMKTAAENERKLWDSELNTIYNDILSHLDEEEKKELVAQEREWMKERDAKAVEAAKEFSGGTMEGLVYTKSLAESTRQRAYELASLYDEIS